MRSENLKKPKKERPKKMGKKKNHHQSRETILDLDKQPLNKGELIFWGTRPDLDNFLSL